MSSAARRIRDELLHRLVVVGRRAVRLASDGEAHRGRRSLSFTCTTPRTESTSASPADPASSKFNRGTSALPGTCPGRGPEVTGCGVAGSAAGITVGRKIRRIAGNTDSRLAVSVHRNTTPPHAAISSASTAASTVALLRGVASVAARSRVGIASATFAGALESRGVVLDFAARDLGPRQAGLTLLSECCTLSCLRGY